MLFTPLDIGPIRAKNRIVFPSFTTGFAERHLVTDRTLTWYRQLAQGGVGTVISETIYVHPTSEALQTVLGSYHPENRDQFARIAEIVEGADCRLIGQLVHMGRSQILTSAAYSGIAPSAIADPYSGNMPRAMTTDEIAMIVDAFARSAALLAEAGFSGVELNAAHGHLLSLFLSPRWNRRTDDYGGDVANRTRMLREVIMAIRAACPSTFTVGVKMVAEDGAPGGIRPEDAATVFRAVQHGVPVDFVSFSFGGIGPTLGDHIPDLTRPVGTYLVEQRRLRDAASCVPTIALGRISSAAQAEQALQDGAGDLAGLGRALAADPDLPRKAQQREPHTTRPCIYCNICWLSVQSGEAAMCPVNPLWGRRPVPLANPVDRRRITIVGGGVVALEAAADLAERGHQVTLLGPIRLGGRIAALSALPILSELRLLVEQLVANAAVAGAHLIRRAAPATTADILATEPDVVYLATGAQMPPPPPALGQCHDHPAVSNINEWTPARIGKLGDSSTSGTAVLLDDGDSLATYALAALLAAHHARAVVLCAGADLAADLPWLTKQSARQIIDTTSVEYDTNAELTGWTGTRLTYRTGGRDMSISNVTHLVWSSRRVADDSLAGLLRQCGLDVRVLGDAAGPTSLAGAIDQARGANDILSRPGHAGPVMHGDSDRRRV